MIVSCGGAGCKEKFEKNCAKGRAWRVSLSVTRRAYPPVDSSPREGEPSGQTRVTKSLRAIRESPLRKRRTFRCRGGPCGRPARAQNGFQGEAIALPCTNSPDLSLESMSDSAGRAQGPPLRRDRRRAIRESPLQRGREATTGRPYDSPALRMTPHGSRCAVEQCSALLYLPIQRRF